MKCANGSGYAIYKSTMRTKKQRGMMTFEEFIDEELKNGLFNDKRLNKAKHNCSFKTYSFDDVRKIIHERFERYRNELKEQNQVSNPSLLPEETNSHDAEGKELAEIRLKFEP